MNKEKFIELFEACIDDIDKWKLLIQNKDIIQEVSIDNDDVTIILDDDNYISFDDFGYTALYNLLRALNIRADFV